MLEDGVAPTLLIRRRLGRIGVAGCIRGSLSQTFFLPQIWRLHRFVPRFRYDRDPLAWHCGANRAFRSGTAHVMYSAIACGERILVIASPASAGMVQSPSEQIADTIVNSETTYPKRNVCLSHVDWTKRRCSLRDGRTLAESGQTSQPYDVAQPPHCQPT